MARKDRHARTGRGSPARGSLALDDQLCFAVYAASRAVTHLYRPLLDALGLTYPQYLVMLVLWERESVTVKALGEALQLDSGTLSPLLKRLAGAGLVERRRRTDDERSVEISLTQAGRELSARANAVPQQIVDAYGLDAAGLAGLRAGLRDLTESVAAADATRRGAESSSSPTAAPRRGRAPSPS